MSSKSIIAPVVLALMISVILSAGCSRYMAPKEYSDKQTAVYTEPNDNRIPGAAARIEIADPEPVDSEYTVREEIRRSYPINPGATVYVSRINGQVRVETADIDHVELLLVRLARQKDELLYNQFAVEQTPENLIIRTVSDERSIFSSLSTKSRDVRQRVFLRVPVKIVLKASRIDGDLIAGQIEGRVELRNISGRVKIDRAFGQSELYGIEGETDVTFAPLNGRGIEIGGISGNVILRFEGEVNADLRVRALNGDIRNELDQVSAEKEPSRSSWKTTQIGTGGPEIQIRGINGNVSLLKAGKTASPKKTGQD